MTILVLIRMVFVIIWEIFQGKVPLNLVLLLGGFKWVHVFISHRKHQFKPHSSPWFSAAYAAAMVYRNHFFRLYQQNKSFESKVKFRQARNRCKRVLEVAKLAYATKPRQSITSQKLGSDFWRIGNSLFNKSRSAILPLFNDLEVLSSVFDKAKLFAENFSKLILN